MRDVPVRAADGTTFSGSELPAANLQRQLLLPGTATDVPEMEQDDLTFCGWSFDTLDQSAFAAEVMTLRDVAECVSSHTVWAKDTSDSITNGFYVGAVSALRK